MRIEIDQSGKIEYTNKPTIVAYSKKSKDVSIFTTQIGKKSRAHDLAWKEFQDKTHKTVQRISAGEIIKIIKKSGNV